LSSELLQKNISNFKVLYVEDHPSVMITNEYIFNEVFSLVDTATNGQEGLDQYNKFYEETGSYYDVVISDINMPVMDGATLSKNLKEINSKQIIVIISAHNESKVLQNLINIGINHFIHKPIKMDELINIMNEVSGVILQQEYEKQLYEQIKLASLGEMIGNIAHQWRQPLTSITTVASGMKLQKELDMLDDETFQNSIDDIMKSAKYLTEVIETFRSFTEKKETFERVTLEEKVERALNLVKTPEEKEIFEIKNEIDFSNPIVLDIPIGTLDIIIINLLNNAKDKLQEKKVQKPWIKLDLIREKEKIIFSVEDNAGGVEDDIIDKIFEPYFTTKHQSAGTGLGLYICHKIMTEKLNGSISVKNTKNGAKFFVELNLSSRVSY